MREFVIDGYNVLHSTAGYARLLKSDFATARDRLVDDVASFAAGAERATVVFDGGGNDGAETETSVGGVRIVYSAAGVTADAVIERLAREVRAEKGAVVVVTADAATQWTVLGEGVTRMSAREFVAELAVEQVERVENERVGPRRSTVGDRVCPETHSGLLRIRDRQERDRPG
jgi:predicted RNA-binding protein with PIN domain